MSRLSQYREMVTSLESADAAYQAVLSEPGLLASTLSFCRLMTEYMLRLASPAYARGEPLTLPLPTPPPMEFAQLPVSMRDPGGVGAPPGLLAVPGGTRTSGRVEGTILWGAGMGAGRLAL